MDKIAGQKFPLEKKNVLVNVISSCFWVEITNSDVEFGTSATIYFEKRSS